MHTHIPIQIFSGAALGQGYNTAHEIAKHIKNNLGLFNLESPGMFKCFTQAKLQTVDELAALLAMYRPGAIEHGLLDFFVSNTPYPMPDELASNGEMQLILKETRGVPVYQDQLFEMMTRVAGLTPEQAAYWMDHMDELGSDEGGCDSRTTPPKKEWITLCPQVCAGYWCESALTPFARGTLFPTPR